MSDEQFIHNARALIERDDTRCVERKSLQEDGPTFHLAVIPEERYQKGRPSFHRGTGSLKTAPLFHGSSTVMQAYQDGYEDLELTLREAHQSRASSSLRTGRCMSRSCIRSTPTTSE